MKKKLCKITALLLAAALSLGGCGQPGAGKKSTDSTQQAEEQTWDTKDDQSKSDKKGPEIEGLTYESTMDLTYATEFDVYYYKDGYKLLDVHEDRQYLVVPEGKEAPEGLPENLVVLQQPLDHIYMAATAIMSLVDAVDAIDQVKFSGVNASGWYVEDAKKAMESGDMIYAGKYSEPDYETLVNGEMRAGDRVHDDLPFP